MFPTSLSELTLKDWIDFTNHTRSFDDELKQIEELPDSSRKQVLITRNYVNKAFESAIFFEVHGELLVEDVIKAYDAFCSLFSAELPTVDVPDISEILTGQFVDAKMIIQAGKDKNMWEIMQYIIATFYFPYRPESLSESSEEFKAAGELPFDKALAVSKWWDDTNRQIGESYSLFHDSGEEEGENMKAHMERWGWINFLVSIAKDKVFDIPGSNMNSIDCVRASKLEDVLTYASQEKDYNIASMRDMQK